MTEPACLNCDRTDEQTPLLAIVFKGGPKYICPQCLPTLIHKPHLLVEKLPGFDPSSIPPHEH